jgi:hypothetical protein
MVQFCDWSGWADQAKITLNWPLGLSLQPSTWRDSGLEESSASTHQYID